jgi:hypothetical protein
VVWVEVDVVVGAGDPDEAANVLDPLDVVDVRFAEWACVASWCRCTGAPAVVVAGAGSAATVWTEARTFEPLLDVVVEPAEPHPDSAAASPSPTMTLTARKRTPSKAQNVSHTA